MKTFFKKTEYHFLIENTKTENVSFSYKTAVSEAYVKTNQLDKRNGEYKMGLSQRTTWS